MVAWDAADLAAAGVYDVLIEFMGQDRRFFDRRDDLLFRFGFMMRPPTTTRTIVFTDDRFDEDLGGDEVYANVSIIPRLLRGDARRTNVVRGNF